MDKHALWKWLSLILFTALSLGLIWPPQEKIKLGLDLQGGTSFVLQLEMEKLDEDAKTDAAERALEVIRGRVDPTGGEEPIIYLEPGRNRIVVQIPGLKAEERSAYTDLLESKAFLEFRMVHEDNPAFQTELFDKGLAPPGFKIVTIEETGFDGKPQQRAYYKRDRSSDPKGKGDRAIFAQVSSFRPKPGYEFMLMKEERRGQIVFSPYYVNKRAQLTGDLLEDASVDYQQFAQPYVNLSFNSKGAKRFARLTADHAPGGAKNPSPDGQRFLAIVLDGKLHSAPYIRSAIYGGNAIIEGSFTVQEAQGLAIILRAGSLPAPVEVVEVRGVDPTLGRDSIRSGSRAILIGGVTVLLFMMAYYLLPGVVANLSLVLNVLLLPFGMWFVSGFLSSLVNPAGTGGSSAWHSLPTLTLPGIAGIVLTIGMAVDANVLIFERIREEQALGKKLRSAVSAGYEKAFTTILDANLTTLITAIILFWKGSGPIRGFAVTLSAGILVSMYTVLLIARMLLDLLAHKSNLPKLKMLSIMKKPAINFVGKRYVAGALSILVITGTWAYFLSKGDDNFGVDFTGGRSITFSFAEKQPVGDLRSALEARGIKESFIQYQRELAPDESGVRKEYLEIKVSYDEGEPAAGVVLDQFGESAGFRVVKEDSVGPQIGVELRKKGIVAILMALLAIILYISWRFEFAFAVGAIVALVHDVLITVGLYCLFGRQLSLPIVAALLTIVGYSVNDTIVVFDRIREDLRIVKNKTYHEIANLSINQTLSRTVLTSITTLLSVVMLLVFGGGAINDFALALLIGILVGTYSSIFVATPVVLLWHKEEKQRA